MEPDDEETGKPGNGHLFWGIIFSLMGALALFRGLMVLAGIPLWALSFLAIGASNLLKAPRIHDILRVSGRGARIVPVTATLLNIAGIAGMLVSLFAGFIA